MRPTFTPLWGLILLACTPEGGGVLHADLDRAGCKPTTGCTITRYQLYAVQQDGDRDCIVTERAASAVDQPLFSDLAWGSDARFGLSVLASCDEDQGETDDKYCVACSGAGQGTARDGAHITVPLATAPRCDPTPGPLCDPTRIWIVSASGALAGNMALGKKFAEDSITGLLLYPNLDAYNHYANINDDDASSFTVSLPGDWTWYLWTRLYYPGTTPHPTNDPNSFWVAVDDRPWLILGNRIDIERTWHWDGYVGRRLPLGYLSAGQHQLRIINREAREGTKTLSPRLDLMLLTNDPGVVPTDELARRELGP